MKKYILFIIIALLPLICMSQNKKKVRAKSTIKIAGYNTNIRDLLDIDGYYDFDSDLENRYLKLIFFEDGTCAPIAFKQKATKDDIKKNLSKWVDGSTDRKNHNWGNYYYQGWGVYKVSGDTLICHSFDKGALLVNWNICEARYKIIDRQTIQRIYWELLLSSHEEVFANHSWWFKDQEAYHFVPADSLPSSDCWLKEEKWIWRNESDWKTYMEKIKAKKK